MQTKPASLSATPGVSAYVRACVRRAGSLCTFPLAPPSRKLRRARVPCARARRGLNQALLLCLADTVIRRGSVRMRSSFAMLLAMVLGLIDSCAASHSAILCSNTCTATQGRCDDGDVGAWYSLCPLGTDCDDCGPRGDHPPPPRPRTPPSQASPPRPPLAPNSVLLCSNTCTSSDPYSNPQQNVDDGYCDDSGLGAFSASCVFGTDCIDCGPRVALPPAPSPRPMAPAPPASFYRCTDSCGESADFKCSDGGPGSEFSQCDLGSDCTDCGIRLIARAPFAVSAAGWPDIVVRPFFGNDPDPEYTWTMICTNSFSIPDGVVPQTIPNPSFEPGSTCTLTLFSEFGMGWEGGASWRLGSDSNPLLFFTFDDPYGFETTYSFTVPLLSPSPPPPSPPNLPPVAPITNNTGFAMVVPQLIITYKFDGFSTACTSSNYQLTWCFPGTALVPEPSVYGTRPWDPRNTAKLVAETITQMGCSGTPRCKVAIELNGGTTNTSTNRGITPGGRRLAPLTLL